MKNTVLQYMQTSATTRKVVVNNLHELYAYSHADEMQHRNGILALRDIDGESPYPEWRLNDAYIYELTDEHGVIISSYFEMTDPKREYMKVDIYEEGFNVLLSEVVING